MMLLPLHYTSSLAHGHDVHRLLSLLPSQKKTGSLPLTA